MRSHSGRIALCDMAPKTDLHATAGWQPPRCIKSLSREQDGAAEMVQRRIAGNNGGNRQESGRLEIDEILSGILRLQKQVDTLDKKLDRLAQPGARS